MSLPIPTLVLLEARRRLLPILAGLTVAACSPAGEADPASLTRTPPSPDTVVFLTQSERPDVQMQALYRGTVTLDEAGCLRLESSGRHTVVWPEGFRPVEEEGRIRVLDREDRRVGRVGGSFRLSGGEVDELHEGIPLDPVDRSAAATRCPGVYWIVGEALVD